MQTQRETKTKEAKTGGHVSGIDSKSDSQPSTVHRGERKHKLKTTKKTLDRQNKTGCAIIWAVSWSSKPSHMRQKTEMDEQEVAP